MRIRRNVLGLHVPKEVVLLFCILIATAGCGSTGTAEQPTVVVNSLEDGAQPPAGKVTLRAAIRDIDPGGRIVFDNSLNGGTILLFVVGDNNSALRGEIYDNTMKFQGYGERNYGKSALYAAKDLTIDASALPGGITLRWTGGDANPARVLAVYGNLTLRNVNISSGFSRAEPIAGGTQHYTLARGGGLAVWGIATLDRCTVSGNRAMGSGDNTAGRDQATYGGGIFANGVVMNNCIVSGNSAIDSGAAGGGIYSVGGADGPGIHSSLTGCTVSGNRVTAQNAYGGGIFTLGGGPNRLMALRLANCTIARNLVEDHPGLPETGGYFYRGGGVYMGGGYLSVDGCTIAENEVRGVLNPKTPNMGGGGIAATVGNAHVVEDITIRHSIVAGNTLNGSAEDLFTGSVLHFYSHGYNLVGTIDFRQILVPIPPWMSLSRKHWPKSGDLDNVALSDVLDVPGAVVHASIVSVGTDNGFPAVLWYPPKGYALDRIPAGGYIVDNVVFAEYAVAPGAKDDFLSFVLDNMLSTGYYGNILGPGFGSDYRTTFLAANGMSIDNVAWNMDPARWPSDTRNQPWINFWRGLDNAIGGSLGTVRLGDDFWRSRGTGQIQLTDNVVLSVTSTTLGPFLPAGSDQRGNSRPKGAGGDIGAIEQ